MCQLMCLECGTRKTRCYIHSGVIDKKVDLYFLFCEKCQKEQERKEVPLEPTGRDFVPGIPEYKETHCPYCGTSSSRHPSKIAGIPDDEDNAIDDGVELDPNSEATLIFEDDSPPAGQGCLT